MSEFKETQDTNVSSSSMTAQPSAVATAVTPMAKAKKMLFAVGGGVLGVWVLLVGLGLSMVGEGGKGSSLADLLGDTPRNVIAKFSLFTYALFAACALIVLVYFIIALVHLMRTPKEDVTRKTHLWKTILSGVVFTLIFYGIGKLSDPADVTFVQHPTIGLIQFSTDWSQTIVIVLFLVLFYLSGTQTHRALKRYEDCLRFILPISPGPIT